jgi:hypothetical protein
MEVNWVEHMRDYTDKIIRICELKGQSDLSEAIAGLARTYGIYPDIEVNPFESFVDKVFRTINSVPNDSLRFSEIADMMNLRPARYDELRNVLRLLRERERIVKYGKNANAKYSVNRELRLVS